MPTTRTGRVDAPGVDAGQRDKPITVQRLNVPPEQADTEGFVVDDWDTLTPLSIWASKNDVVGEERFHGGQLASPYEARWGIDYRQDMDPDMIDIAKERRVVYLGRVHDIVDANVVGDFEGIEFRTLARRG